MASPSVHRESPSNKDHTFIIYRTILSFLLLATLATSTQASVAGEAVEGGVRLAGRSSEHIAAIEAASLGGTLGIRAVEAGGDRATAILRAAQAAGEDVQQAARLLIEHPALLDTGYDGIRVASLIGSERVPAIARFGARGLSAAGQDWQSAINWSRLAQSAEQNGYDAATNERIGIMLGSSPRLIERVLEQAPRIGLGAALAAVGIGVGAAAIQAPEAIAGPIGLGLAAIPVGLTVILLGYALVAWILPAWWRNRRTAIAERKDS